MWGELAPEWRRAFAFIEETVGGRIVRHHRHPRWRPAFDVDVERDGEIVPVHFRGERPQVGLYPIEHECRAFQVLEQEGVLVPHVYAYCKDPAGIVMERAPGRPSLGTAESESDGCGFEIDRWIAPGAVVELEADRIGVLRHHIAAPDGEPIRWRREQE